MPEWTGPSCGGGIPPFALLRVRDISLNSRARPPVCFSIDQEGDYSQDYARGGVHFFASQMGMTATGREAVVVTKTPYPLSIPAEAGTVILAFSTMPPALEHAARVIYGKAQCDGQWPLTRLAPT